MVIHFSSAGIQFGSSNQSNLSAPRTHTRCVLLLGCVLPSYHTVACTCLCSVARCEKRPCTTAVKLTCTPCLCRPRPCPLPVVFPPARPHMSRFAHTDADVTDVVAGGITSMSTAISMITSNMTTASSTNTGTRARCAATAAALPGRPRTTEGV